ncbi:SLAP domain-containing protein [Companilactobacillus huachuanensis]|uniref:SLAP domain-containing protein n=1 Tax=Companilactobacillus huachuanensis TaxID=2559914 RepID=A0ABW1RHF3_9LACO|nr:SLAP domain-containing protein [Companilactobacillus huachuanensis]
MLLNKKCVYLGVSLFSAMILGVMSSQTVKADTISSPTTSAPAASSTTSATPTTTSAPTSSTTSTTTTISTGTAAPATTSTVTPTTSSSTATTVTSAKTGSPATSAPVSTASVPVTSGTTTGSSAVTTPATSSTAPVTTGTSTTSSTTASTPATSGTTTTSSTVTTPATSSTAPVTTGTSTTSSTTAPASTGSTPATSGTTTTTPASSTSTSATSGTTTATTTTTGTTTSPYAIPSNVTNDTVITFTDPNLESAVKFALNIPYTSNLTVGDVRSYTGQYLLVSMDYYELAHPNGPTSTSIPGSYISDEDSTPIESLNGMQYLTLLPAKSTVGVQVLLASDTNANPDLTPLNGIPLASLDLAGNFSDSTAKEIDVSQVSKLDLSVAGTLDFEGSTDTNGINQAQLNELAPTINQFANNGQGLDLIEFDNSSISDFSPLKGTETGKNVMIDAVSNTVTDPTPVYAVDGQPISFTAPKLLDPSGIDLAPQYTYSGSTTSADLKNGNLTSVGGDDFTLNNADPTAKTLSYGNYGYHNGFTKGSMIQENLGNTYFENATTVNQPLIWQAAPTVTVNYVDSTGAPIMVNGAPLTKTISGTTIGSAFDLTTDSDVSGYKLTSPATLLKGAYTQDPQTITLAYSSVPKTSTDSDTTKPIVKPAPNPKHPATSNNHEKVAIHDLTNDPDLTDINVHGTTIINGKPFYLLDDGEFIEANDYDAVASTKTGILITHDVALNLVDDKGQPTSEKLASSTKWKYNKIVAINGQAYYQLARDGYLAVDSATTFTPSVDQSKIHLSVKTAVYNSQGKKLTLTLAAGSNWRTDGYITVNGIKMYRVATNEYVPE